MIQLDGVDTKTHAESINTYLGHQDAMDELEHEQQMWHLKFDQSLSQLQQEDTQVSCKIHLDKHKARDDYPSKVQEMMHRMQCKVTQQKADINTRIEQQKANLETEIQAVLSLFEIKRASIKSDIKDTKLDIEARVNACNARTLNTKSPLSEKEIDDQRYNELARRHGFRERPPIKDGRIDSDEFLYRGRSCGRR